ncbi:hypothetical protein PR048_017902 [Dryococelus australis]|uniref:Uncharacterized protein n=1 Tax=Dryococelus australis TaxID=614101 RepID=A0ABQ9HB49_9NEOP|nr:hypothetical protein PR048_017902 [Dryococelus australis]
MIRAIIVYLFLYHTGCLESYRILGVFPSKSRSHFLITGTIMKSLASRGHEVFVVSYFPQSSPTARYKDVIIPADTIPEMSTVSVGTVARNSPIPSLRELYTWGVYSCEATFNAPQVQELLASEASFDLVMVEVFNADCLFAFAHRFQAPLVGVSTGILLPWASDVFGNPDNPSYIPAHFFPYPVRMSFWQRLVNAVSLVLFKAVHKTVFSREADRMARKYLGENVPSVEEIARTMSLQLVNTHLSLHQPRPMVPAVVEVGGLHLREPTNISKVTIHILR